MNLPNFLICGAAQSGTSHLAAMLAAHPQVYLARPLVPEPHFFYFSEYRHRDLGWYRTRWFADADGFLAVGEKSTSYMLDAAVASRVRDALPDVRLIFLLRDPAERAYSNYRFTCFNGLEELSFLDALECEERRGAGLTGRWQEVRPYAYVARSRYAALLDPFVELFGHERLLVLTTEEMRRDATTVLSRVARFLVITVPAAVPPVPRFSVPSVVSLALQAEVRSRLGPAFASVTQALRRGARPQVEGLGDEQRAWVRRLVDNLSHETPAPSAEEMETVRLRLGDDPCAACARFNLNAREWRTIRSASACTALPSAIVQLSAVDDSPQPSTESD